MSAYSPAHDPILVAGYLRCWQCGAAAFPSDAEWLNQGTGLILASYPGPCEHGGQLVLVLDAEQVTTSRAWCNEIAVTTGAPCRHRAIPGSLYCRQHNGQARGAGMTQTDGA